MTTDYYTSAPDGMFVEALERAFLMFHDGRGMPRVVDFQEPPVLTADEIDIDVKLPAGVARQSTTGRLYAYCYMPRVRPAQAYKLTFGAYEATAENAALLAGLAAYARRLRDNGMEADEIKRLIQCRAAGRGE